MCVCVCVDVFDVYNCGVCVCEEFSPYVCQVYVHMSFSALACSHVVSSVCLVHACCVPHLLHWRLCREIIQSLSPTPLYSSLPVPHIGTLPASAQRMLEDLRGIWNLPEEALYEMHAFPEPLSSSPSSSWLWQV